jgi:NAD(P)H-quinone oxidoreductase subunit 4
MLSALIWLPLVGAAMIGFFPGEVPAAQIRKAAIAISSLILLWTLALFTQFDLSVSGMQLSEFFTWIPTLGLNYRLGVDGLSLPLVALTNLLTLVVIFSSDSRSITSISLKRPRLFYALVLAISAGMAGALLAQNLLLFFLFYEIELIPFYLLIVIWGSERRDYAGIKFLIYTAVSGILILAAFLALNWLTGASSFDYTDIQTQGLSQQTQLILLTLMLVGFGIKIPLVPLHTWLPDAYVESSASTAILLGGVLAKLGTYGLVRFCLGLFPETWSLVTPGLSILAAVCVLYGAMAAIAQKDIKRMVAYSSIGHMGYVLLGTAALTPLAMVGAVSQMISHGLILALLFYLVGVIEEKVGTRDLDVLNGLLNPIRGLPLTSALLILAGMASAGIPGMAGFVAEFLVFQGSYSAFPLPTLLCIAGTALTAVYFVILLNRTCFGKLSNYTAYYPRVTFLEQAPALILTALIIWLGVQPSWMVRWSETTTTAIVAATPLAESRRIAQQPILNVSELKAPAIVSVKPQ